MRILTAAETRAVDREAIAWFGVPGLLLMEHAARAVADAAREGLGPSGRVFVVTGAGNNGGDGWAAARLLLSGGVTTRVIAVQDPAALSGDAATNAALYAAFGGDAASFSSEALAGACRGDVVVDALLGTGLSRPPEGAFREAIVAMNDARERGAFLVAVDVPSGLPADGGEPPGAVVRADHTPTFGALKVGLAIPPGRELAGAVEVAPISWPPALLQGLSPSLELLEEEEIRALLPRRESRSHKGSYGHCLVVAGSPGKSGAAALAARGALVGGAGLVTVATRSEVAAQVLGHAMEVMAAPLAGEGALGDGDVPALLAACEGKDAVLAGPGIPRGPRTREAIGRLLAEVRLPFVLDADALNALAGDPSPLARAAGEVVITPHPGEMARLLGATIAEVQADRIGTARRFAAAHGCVVVLKGAGTVVAGPGGDAAICPTGNAGMATAGTGDVLAGLLAALLAQGMRAPDAARAAVYVHGEAGDRMIARTGMAGLVASDLLAGIREVWRAWSP